MPTISVTELIRQAFDKFYEDCKFKGIYIPRNMEDLLKQAEEDCVSHALSEYTTEMEEIKEYAYDDGYENGREVGYDEGYQDGYEQAMNNGDE